MFKFILASGSPRRKELLTLAGIQFELKVPEVNEDPLNKESPQKMVKRLAELKAKTVLKENFDKFINAYILAADTTVVSSKGKNLGKPRDLNDAFKMLKALQGKNHSVFTSYCILKIINGKIKKKKLRTVKTTVTFRKMKDPEIHAYLSHGESMDKAGAYAAQGAGMILVSKMIGSYTNVVGLPISHVLDDLCEMGFKVNG